MLVYNSRDKLLFEGAVAALQKGAYIEEISKKTQKKEFSFQSPLVFCAHFYKYRLEVFVINLREDGMLDVLDFPMLEIQTEEELEKAALLHIRILEFIRNSNLELAESRGGELTPELLTFWSKVTCTKDCEYPPTGDLIQCNKCKRWYHPIHVNLSQDDFEKHCGSFFTIYLRTYFQKTQNCLGCVQIVNLTCRHKKNSKAKREFQIVMKYRPSQYRG